MSNAIEIPNTRECFASYMGIWAILPNVMKSMLSAVRDRIMVGTAENLAAAGSGSKNGFDGTVTDDDVAIVQLNGILQKTDSKFGGATSTIRARQSIRAAARDSRVEAILLSIDSPGGTVAGAGELARDIAAAATVKPVHAYIDDQGASAAYWAASQAQRISANETADVGSIGVYAVLEDITGMLEADGVKLHVVSTGSHKGLGADGSVPDELVIEVQDRIDAINKIFKSSVSRGRNFDAKTIDDIATGKTWIAADAKKMGLVDAVQNFDAAYRDVVKVVREKRRERRTKADAARARLRL